MFALKSPAKIIWEITTMCTRTCHFCYNCSGGNGADRGSKEQRRAILAQIIDCEPLYVVVTGGEPLLLTDELLSILEQLRARNIYTQLWTNGDLLTENCAHALVENCDLVTLPLFGKSAASHDGMMGPGSFSAIMNALEMLHKINIEVAWVLTKDNYRELSDVAATLSQHSSIRYVTLYQYVQAGRGLQLDYGISKAVLEETMTNVASLNREYSGKFNVSIDESSGEIRNLLQDRHFNYQVYIRADGEVLAHQYLRIKVKVAQIWKSGSMSAHPI